MNNFVNLVKKVKEKGGFIHPSLVRRKTDKGIYGIFTNKCISKNTLILQIPNSFTIKKDTNNVCGEMNDQMKTLYNFIIEGEKNDESEFYEMFNLYPTIEELSVNSIFFYDEKLVSILCDIFDNKYNMKIKQFFHIASQFKEFFPKLSDNRIKYYIAIWMLYSWTNYMAPILELFNNNSNGNQIIKNEKGYFLYSSSDVKENEQLFINYNRDTISYALHYSFYDENDTTVLSFPCSFSTSESAFSFQKAKLLIDLGWKYKVVTENNKPKIFCNTEIFLNKKIPKLTKDALVVLVSRNEHELKSPNTKMFWNLFKILLQINLKSINNIKVERIKELGKNHQYIFNSVKDSRDTIQLWLSFVDKNDI